jgi:hypothetical protein
MDGPRPDTGRTLLELARGSARGEFYCRFLDRTSGTILVVDDTDDVLEVLVAILEAAHFVVLQADSGPKALELAANCPGRNRLASLGCHDARNVWSTFGRVTKAISTESTSITYRWKRFARQWRLGFHSKTVHVGEADRGD